MQMKLAEYLDRFSWSQAELSRQANVSPQCVRRALAGEKIARRNAEKIVAALDRKFQTQGAKAHITMGSIKGLQIRDLRHKQPAQKASGNEAAARL